MQERVSERMRDPRRMCTMLGLLAAIAMFATAMASSAQASTITIDSSGDFPVIAYNADPGETNNVVVNDTSSDTIVSDTGATINPGSGPCTVDATGHTATCPNARGLGVAGVAIQTGDGDDRIVGGSAPDLTENSIDAGTGSDIVDTGGGFDRAVEGGALPGVDTVTFASRPASVSVEAELRFGVSSDGNTLRSHSKETQNGTIIGGVFNMSGFENVVGGRGDDVLIGDEQDNVLIGGPGPDTGADIMCGSLGSDTVDYSGNALSQYGVVVPGSPEGVHVTLDGPMPTDPRLATVDPAARQDCRSIDEASTKGDSLDPRTNPVDCTPDDGIPGEGDCLGDDVENVIGSDHNDVLIGNDPDPLYGGGPRVEPSGVNHLDGGAGDDVLDGRGGPDVLDGGSGNDTVSYASRTEPIKASLDGSANDGGVGDLNPAYPDAAQADSIGTDVENITGGAGNDVLRGDESANVLDGGEGDDTLSGNGGQDTLAGGGGADNLSGGDGNDALGGGPGDDTLDGGFGGDTLSGGDGTDLVDYSNEISPVSAVPNGVADDGSAGEGDNLGGDVESLQGGPASDVLVGNDGSGTLAGGAGDDVLDGAAGADILTGGPGIDTASYAGRTASVFVDEEVGGGDGETGENDTVAGDVERVVGGAGADTLTGNGSANILIGRDGNDTLSGRGGPDTLFGGPGNDTVNGDDGNDSLFGEEGTDKLFGGAGSDREDGGGGDDSLDGGLGADVLNGGPGMDTAVYSGRTKDVNADVRGADDSGEKNEKDQIRTTVEGAKTGAGDDTINIRDGGKGVATCGRGVDTVMADPGDSVSADCEQVNVLASGRCSVRTGSATMSRRGTVAIRLTCPVAAKGTLRLTGGGVTLGSKSFSLKAGKSATVRVKLSKKGRRIVKRKKRLKASATVKPRRKGVVKSTTKRLTIRAAKGKG